MKKLVIISLMFSASTVLANVNSVAVACRAWKSAADSKNRQEISVQRKEDDLGLKFNTQLGDHRIFISMILASSTSVVIDVPWAALLTIDETSSTGTSKTNLNWLKNSTFSKEFSESNVVYVISCRNESLK